MRQRKTLSNPTHAVVDRAGQTLVSIKHTRNTVTMRLEQDMGEGKAGEVSGGYGPSGADGVMMGRFAGYMAFLFGGDVANALPEGARIIEIGAKELEARAKSTFAYSGEIVSDLAPRATTALYRATASDHFPATAQAFAATMIAAQDHLAALACGTFRKGEISGELRGEFRADALALIDYLKLFPFYHEED